ncbi:DNA-directed RNA polymerase subunit beta [Ornithinibacillus californiensis]|uniref:DNA-directed RNA polymerase subunit beta n=1 Tax=Ornithinibacillus californiensis TaxID=161536 RepID=UPI001F4917B6|nr:DNA-directed RNA polymerase subunit beta [Ornithinibacillus californiensis]
MSPTNQFEKTKEETRTRRLRVEASTEDKRPDKRSSESEAKPSVRKEDTSSSKELSPEKEQRRRRSASAEMEMTETLKQTRKLQKKQQKIEKRKNKKPRLRIFPIWLRLVIVSGLCVLALGYGLMFGYGGLGEGEPSDALEWETWQHIIDIIFKAE